ncbi:hypothetical protein N9W46_00050 [Litoricolaceae bacterium]|nr:hypothetical protein [Litorivicinaceae bacterium]
MATDTRTMIERAASIYALEQPSETEFEAYVSRIETGSLTLSSAIEEIALVSNREEATNPLARMFFLLFDRAPDPVLFAAGMSALRGGATLEDIAETGLLYAGLSDDNAQAISDSDFVDHLVSSIWVSPPNGFDADVFVDLLTTISRADLLVAAAKYSDPMVSYENDVETSLIYLAAANRQATSEELDQASSQMSLSLIRDVLLEADEDPYAGNPFWLLAGNTLLAKGNYADELVIDATNDLATLGDASDFQVIITRDGGSTESTVTFRSSLLDGITRIDARQMDSESTGAITLRGATTTYGPPTDATIEGSSQNDNATGNLGNDTLIATAGYDSLTGGLGNDLFQFASAETYESRSFTTINDFGSGDDVLDFSKVFGNVESAAATIIAGVGDPASADFPTLNTMTADAVVVIEHAGVWPAAVADSPQISSGTLTARTQQQIFDLFANVTFDTIPTRGERYIVITTDQINGGDAWLIENLTNLSTIEVSEITKIGHIDSNDPDLFTLLSANGAVFA